MQAKLTLAKAQLNSLKQQKKPDVDAINKAKATVATIQGQINGLKQKKQPTVDVNGAPAKQTLAGIGGQLGALKDKTVTVTVKRAGIGGSIGAATGGARSGMAIVGERGPELVALPEGSQVYTHSQSLRMMATGHYGKGKKAKASAKAKQKAKDKAARDAAYAAEKAAAQDQINELRGTGPGRSSLVDIANERQGLIDRITGNVSSFVGIGNYDVSARSDALAEAAAAQSEVNNSAVGSSARQSAMARLRAAQDKVASAPASVGAWLRQRVDKVRRWKDVPGRPVACGEAHRQASNSFRKSSTRALMAEPNWARNCCVTPANSRSLCSCRVRPECSATRQRWVTLPLSTPRTATPDRRR